MKYGIYLIVAVFGVFIYGSELVPDLDNNCFQCLCRAATGCNMTYPCIKGYCGPFHISKIYWVEADKPVIEADDPKREGAYEECTKDYDCSVRTIEAYMTKLQKDCNSDGKIDCQDYAYMHHNGGYHCEGSLDGLAYYERFLECREEQYPGSVYGQFEDYEPATTD